MENNRNYMTRDEYMGFTEYSKWIQAAEEE